MLVEEGHAAGPPVAAPRRPGHARRGPVGPACSTEGALGWSRRVGVPDRRPKRSRGRWTPPASRRRRSAASCARVVRWNGSRAWPKCARPPRTTRRSRRSRRSRSRPGPRRRGGKAAASRPRPARDRQRLAVGRVDGERDAGVEHRTARQLRRAHVDGRRGGSGRRRARRRCRRPARRRPARRASAPRPASPACCRSPCGCRTRRGSASGTARSAALQLVHQEVADPNAHERIVPPRRRPAVDVPGGVARLSSGPRAGSPRRRPRPPRAPARRR